MQNAFDMKRQHILETFPSVGRRLEFQSESLDYADTKGESYLDDLNTLGLHLSLYEGNMSIWSVSVIGGAFREFSATPKEIHRFLFNELRMPFLVQLNFRGIAEINRLVLIDKGGPIVLNNAAFFGGRLIAHSMLSEILSDCFAKKKVVAFNLRCLDCLELAAGKSIDKALQDNPSLDKESRYKLYIDETGRHGVVGLKKFLGKYLPGSTIPNRSHQLSLSCPVVTIRAGANCRQ